MAAFTVPRTPAEMTPEWLTAALRESGRLPVGNVTALDITEIGVGRGYVGLTLRLVPTYHGAPATAPASMVAKLPTFVELARDTDRALVNLLYSNEIQWYRDFGPGCPARVPASYWGGMEAAERRFCLLLEDLGDMRMTDQATSCSVEEARAVVKALARIHAHWWESDQLAATPWLLTPAVTGALFGGLYALGWAPFWEAIGSTLPPAFRAVGEALATRYGQLLTRAADSAKTMVHGDYRVENILFGQPGTADELVILDWQLISSGPGSYDLAYFISQSLAVEHRRADERNLLHLYHDTLRAHGVAGYPFEQCYEDYRLGLLLATAIPVNGARTLVELTQQGGGTLTTEEQALFERALGSGRSLIAMMAERNVAAIFDNDAHLLLR